MADTKISELPVATVIASPDVAPVVRAGVTMQADVSLFSNPSGMLAPVFTVSTGNIDLVTGGIPDPTLTDGVTVEIGKRVLVWQQSQVREIGIYVVQMAEWTRSPDLPTMYPTISGSPAFIDGSPIDGITVPTGSSNSLFSGALFQFLAELEAFVPVAGGAVQAYFNYTLINGPEQLRVLGGFNGPFSGSGDGIVFPDSDPHIVGAGYWLAGVLTRSAG